MKFNNNIVGEATFCLNHFQNYRRHSWT